MQKENIFYMKKNHFNPYEQTFICLIASYLRINPSINVTELKTFCDTIDLEYNRIKPLIDFALKHDNFNINYLNFIDKSIAIDNFDHMLLECLLYYEKIQKLLNDIILDNSSEALKINTEIFLKIRHFINMINVNSGTYECMKNNKFSREHAPQSFESFNPNPYIEFFENCSLFEEYYCAAKELLIILYATFIYYIQTHVHAMYSIVAFQLLKSSIFFRNDMKIIAGILYFNLHKLLKDARVINVLCNTRYFDIKVPQEQRGKFNNTTRLEIVYGYDNFDVYSLRLDTAHKGINFFHFNNTSPQNITFYPITQKEYEYVIGLIPDSTSCFISYKNLWFVRENYKTLLDKEKLKKFDILLKNNSHFKVLPENTQEKSILEFLNIAQKLFFPHFHKLVDYEGSEVQLSFKHDKLMFFLNIYLTRLISNATPESIEHIFDLILQKAQEIGIVDSDTANWLRKEKKLYSIKLIIDELKTKE